MGEIAEAMLDGLLCEQCGEPFGDIIAGGDAPGHPRRCEACERTEATGKPRRRRKAKAAAP